MLSLDVRRNEVLRSRELSRGLALFLWVLRALVLIWFRKVDL